MMNFTKKILLTATLVATSFGYAQDTMTAVDFPTSVALGSTQTVKFNYTASVDGTCEIQIVPLDANDNTVYDGAMSYKTGIPVPAAATTTLFTTTANIASAIPQKFIDAGYTSYRWFTYITVAGTTTYLQSATQFVSFTGGTMGLESFVNPRDMYVNKAAKLLVVNKSGAYESASVYDVTGKTVMNFKLANASNVDLSKLTTGVYILVTNDNKKLKFML
ncbi:T9SS type A sorting domain-containing protein [Flavobacterium franklandianum]|uniref:T9SS type A sorting domain-containing protein n=1 Tax=Flavobacterium franklandianum TaxID=2594430 RepID=A0A553C7W5_9FLAO|nr:T9SS type A sorting domain-containing protein [Flavobacterium franklandianum]TRX16611.1 T9SS type A sorting domain-containing protein [Flavobacterium franklandianum]TRX24632.1 T9SS type A sorting domain-containing protein [Flavobacterium franklandianum]